MMSLRSGIARLASLNTMVPLMVVLVIGQSIEPLRLAFQILAGALGLVFFGILLTSLVRDIRQRNWGMVAFASCLMLGGAMTFVYPPVGYGLLGASAVFLLYGTFVVIRIGRMRERDRKSL
jgi:hypothetical protein